MQHISTIPKKRRMPVGVVATIGVLTALALATPTHAASPPANDAFADAERVRVPAEHTGVIADATTELGEPRVGTPAPQRSVWFRLRATGSYRLTVDATRSQCHSIQQLAVYTGRRLDALRRVASGDGVVRLRTVRGRTYHVALDCLGGIHTLGRYVVAFSDGSVQDKGLSVTPAAGQTVETVRSRGLRTTLTARRDASLGIELRVRPAVARALCLDGEVLGRIAGAVHAGQSLAATITLTAAARRALEGEEAVDAILRLRLRSDAPNRVLDVPLSLPT